MLWFCCFSSLWSQSDNFEHNMGNLKVEILKYKIKKGVGGLAVHWIERKAKENSWPQFDAVTILCAKVGIHGMHFCCTVQKTHHSEKRGHLKKVTTSVLLVFHYSCIMGEVYFSLLYGMEAAEVLTDLYKLT